MTGLPTRYLEGSPLRNARDDFFEVANFLGYYEEFAAEGWLTDSTSNWRCAAQILNVWRKVHDDLTPEEQAWVAKMAKAMDAAWAHVNPPKEKAA